MGKNTKSITFIDYLYSLVINQRRGALADLRRGLSDPPASSPVMFPYIARWVPDKDRFSWREKVYYLVAALFAFYQSGGGIENKIRTRIGNFGDQCHKAANGTKQSDSFEMRFSVLLKSNDEDLPVHLRQMVSLLKSEDIPINWDQLFQDLRYWNNESQYVQRRWANAFWAYQNQSQDDPANE